MRQGWHAAPTFHAAEGPVSAKLIVYDQTIRREKGRTNDHGIMTRPHALRRP